MTGSLKVVANLADADGAIVKLPVSMIGISSTARDGLSEEAIPASAVECY